ncbi:MAG: lon [Clostridia bacterium]|jgi:ATP-dependent Lon protease|nr:lon [Clostridia bacterium]
MKSTDNKNKEALIIPLPDGVLLPNMESTLKLENLSIEEVSYLAEGNNLNIALPLKKVVSGKELKEEDFQKVGVIFQVDEIKKKEIGHEIKIKVIDRVEVAAVKFANSMIYGAYQIASDCVDLDQSAIEEILAYMKKIIYDIGKNFQGSENFIKPIEEIKDLNKLMGYLAQFRIFSMDKNYELLHTQSLKERSLKFIDYLLEHKERVKFQLEITEKFSEKANKNYRESILREQLKVIQEELNEGKSNELDYLTKIEEAGMPEDVKNIALEEQRKFESQSPNSPDYNVIRNYLDLLLQLPWKKASLQEFDLIEARRILEEQHYGLEKVKERILQHLAVMKLKKDKKGSILLLVGPPGTGKTSLGKSISEALNRKYVRLSLGGIRDEAEIRGHRKTYVGAMPGRIIQSIKKAGEKNPVIVLDEVDKLIRGYNGDPASALLEVLDPEQNDSFTDHYLGVPYDLSEVFFIATANSIDSIPAPLLDRMEVIQISSYTLNEKFHIAKKHLIPSILEEHGLTSKQLKIDDKALQRMISDYTLEAGVRGLKKQLSKAARVTSEKIVSRKIKTAFKVTENNLEELLGRRVSRHDKAEKDNPPGVVTGLAWTPVGGEILFIEATDMWGKGEVILTGKLGDVMKESARISLSLLKSRLPLNSFNFKEKDLHIHVPSGSVPKDGPSAGITLFTALASLVTGIKVDSTLAMTGEITLRGVVLAIGGLKEKLLAAERAGIKKVLIPKDNVIDLKDVPEEVKNALTIIPVESIEDVLKETLGISLPRLEQLVSFSAFQPSLQA